MKQTTTHQSRGKTGIMLAMLLPLFLGAFAPAANAQTIPFLTDSSPQQNTNGSSFLNNVQTFGSDIKNTTQDANTVINNATKFFNSPNPFGKKESDVGRGSCSSDPSFEPIPPVIKEGVSDGIISKIIGNIEMTLKNVSKGLYTAIVEDVGFMAILRGVLTLYVAIYGIMFMVGMVEIKLYDFVIRMVKVGVVLTLIAPKSWEFFSQHVVTFFNEGTFDIINAVSAIMLGEKIPAAGAGGGIFWVLDKAVGDAASGKMFVTLLATFATGPYGVLFGILLLLSLGSFLRSLLTAMWVYVMSLAVKTLLFGLAPIFIICILFQRTRHLFDGWLNQIINASLQPVLLFIFFGFFVLLMSACLANILHTPVCWTEFPQGWRGTDYAFYYWRFAVESSPGSGKFMPYAGEWGPGGANVGGAAFPLDLMTILTFLILAELASKFNTIVIQISQELASASTSLAGMQGAMGEMFSGRGNMFGAGGLGGDAKAQQANMVTRRR